MWLDDRAADAGGGTQGDWTTCFGYTRANVSIVGFHLMDIHGSVYRVKVLGYNFLVVTLIWWPRWGLHYIDRYTLPPADYSICNYRVSVRLTDTEMALFYGTWRQREMRIHEESISLRGPFGVVCGMEFDKRMWGHWNQLLIILCVHRKAILYLLFSRNVRNQSFEMSDCSILMRLCRTRLRKFESYRKFTLSTLGALARVRQSNQYKYNCDATKSQCGK